jgi:hypothetical protein
LIFSPPISGMSERTSRVVIEDARLSAVGTLASCEAGPPARTGSVVGGPAWPAAIAGFTRPALPGVGDQLREPEPVRVAGWEADRPGGVGGVVAAGGGHERSAKGDGRVGAQPPVRLRFFCGRSASGSAPRGAARLLGAGIDSRPTFSNPPGGFAGPVVLQPEALGPRGEPVAGVCCGIRDRSYVRRTGPRSGGGRSMMARVNSVIIAILTDEQLKALR